MGVGGAGLVMNDDLFDRFVTFRWKDEIQTYKYLLRYQIEGERLYIEICF